MGTRTVSQTINLQTPDQTSKYIKSYTTEIGNKGIFVHPEGDNVNGVEISDSIIIKRNGEPVSTYGERTILGNIESYHIEIAGGINSELGFYYGSGEDFKVAYINGNQLYIPQVVVVTSMQVGDPEHHVGAWRWIVNEEGTMGLYWVGGVNNGD